MLHKSTRNRLAQQHAQAIEIERTECILFGDDREPPSPLHHIAAAASAGIRSRQLSFGIT
jgi:hypothetical protein